MRTKLHGRLLSIVVFVVAVAVPAVAQRGAAPAAATASKTPAPAKRDAQGHPDLTGMWNNQYTPDIASAAPGELPFTPYGLERWKNVDTSKDPTGVCLPVGPSRAFTAPFPVHFLQTPQVVGALFEYQTTWRMFYIGGKHPEDLGDYGSEFMGHSTAEWQGDALVVDTIGINERSWLDTAGHEHSDKLHLIERFEKLDEENLRYSVTYEDPVFFTKPFTIVRNFKRGAAADRILPYSCEENNVDRDHLVPHTPNKKE